MKEKISLQQSGYLGLKKKLKTKKSLSEHFRNLQKLGVKKRKKSK